MFNTHLTPLEQPVSSCKLENFVKTCGTNNQVISNRILSATELSILKLFKVFSWEFESFCIGLSDVITIQILKTTQNAPKRLCEPICKPTSQWYQCKLKFVKPVSCKPLTIRARTILNYCDYPPPTTPLTENSGPRKGAKYPGGSCRWGVI